MLQPGQPLDVSLDQRTFPRTRRTCDKRVGSKLACTEHDRFTREVNSQQNGLARMWKIRLGKFDYRWRRTFRRWSTG